MRWLYYFPFILLFTLFISFPVLNCLYTALSEPSLFLRMFSDGEMLASLANTLVFTAISVVLELALGLFLALLARKRFRGTGLLRASILIPWALPAAVMAAGWGWMLHDQFGVIGDLLHRAGIIQEAQKAWLSQSAWAKFWIIITDTWKTAPFAAVIFLAGLASIPAEVEEAARMDGAGALKRFLSITFPLLKPYLAVALLFRSIQAFGVFDHIWVLTGGGPAGSTRTLALYAYDTVFRYLDLSYGAVLTIFMGLCMAAIAGLSAALRRHA